MNKNLGLLHFILSLCWYGSELYAGFSDSELVLGGNGDTYSHDRALRIQSRGALYGSVRFIRKRNT